ncbi:MAG TPA: virulence protein RhuM/Fic/DOC family protein [Sediminibacterium sp.]|uniref:virulence protein RhuM/Fic/DOC family protein n=1 Tax=Sediminibacterium sp. TaxID=1917865 RepID=UPI0008B1C250|nr:virulence protein RhuM/Fic/DOC family protein [Sediminibacterium sp.]OHC85474.1 MAG: death-on-curing protein [Sphingobacteriia bacterium RIFOXYC2_FULL_35_18]HLD52902.1 virulence protein RhuM/Fic/DOC family protein [Sediminibacterium sp.]
MNEVIIYQSKDKKTQIDVKFENDTVWLTQQQMAELFGQTKQNVSLHINNCFKEKELTKKATVKDSLTVRKEGKREVKRKIEFYNLDVIISVGYRVKSVRGTQFRQWASQVLKDFLVEGIAVNNKRLEQKNKEIQILHDGIRILSRVIEEKIDISDNFGWLNSFNLGLQLLDDYDHESLDTKGNHNQIAKHPDINEYLDLLNQMRSDFNSDIFGKQKDKGFESAVNQIKQSFGDKDAYPSIEEKAAMLLYLVVKNHAFVDGNKRIAAACFLLFLERNELLYNKNNQPLISNEALASITLLVAASKAEEMETVKKLLISVLNRNMK